MKSYLKLQLTIIVVAVYASWGWCDNWATLNHDYQRTSRSEDTLADCLTIRIEIPIGAVSGFAATPVVVNDTIYAGNVGNTLRVLSNSTGQEVWHYTSTSNVSSASVWGDYAVVSETSNVLVFDRHSGTLLRSIPHAGVGNNGVVAICNGIAYVTYGVYGCGIFAVTLNTGNIIWDTPHSGYGFYSPSISDDNTKIVASTASTGTYVCFSAQNGNVLWEYPSGVNWGNGVPVIVGDRVYLTASGTSPVVPADLVCLNLNNGNVVWRVDITPQTYGDSHLAIEDGRIYFGGVDSGYLYCYDTNGNQLWTVSLGAEIGHPLISGNNKIVCATTNGNVYQINDQTGQILQTIPLGFNNFGGNNTSFALYETEWYGYLGYGSDWRLTVLGSGGIQPPSASIDLTPYNPPIVIPTGGGSFAFDVQISNNSSSTQTFDAWTNIENPIGFQFTSLGPFTLTFTPGFSLTRMRAQAVPGSAPAGDYIYWGCVGTYPWTVVNYDSFAFTKEGLDGSWTGLEGWLCYGEPFPSEISADKTLPEHYILLNASPNPFNPTTTLRYTLPAAARVKLSIFDIRGRLVANLVDGFNDAGVQEAYWDAAGLPSGIYCARLEAGSRSAAQKLVLLK